MPVQLVQEAGIIIRITALQHLQNGDVVYVTKISDLNVDNSGTQNRFAGVVEAQETVKVNIESGRKVKEVQVKTGDEVKKGQLAVSV